MPTKTPYSEEPKNSKAYTQRFDHFYSRFARIFDWSLKVLPIWRSWLNHAIPFLQGTRVLEVSYGTGYLLTQYANRFQAYGIDLNTTLTAIAKQNLRQHGITARLQVADVAALPYADSSFDTVVNTMSFTGYPDGTQALAEISRVLRPGGCLVVIDINYPSDGNRLGILLTKAWACGGDIVRDMGLLFEKFGFQYTDTEIGGFGSVHLFVGTKS